MKKKLYAMTDRQVQLLKDAYISTGRVLDGVAEALVARRKTRGTLRDLPHEVRAEYMKDARAVLGVIEEHQSSKPERDNDAEEDSRE